MPAKLLGNIQIKYHNFLQSHCTTQNYVLKLPLLEFIFLSKNYSLEIRLNAVQYTLNLLTLVLFETMTAADRTTDTQKHDWQIRTAALRHGPKV